MEKFLSGFVLLVAAVLLLPGCFAEETATIADVNITEIAPVGEEMLMNATYTADMNTTNLTMAIDETVRVTLRENPTTGYMWNATNSSGLEIVNDTYFQDVSPKEMTGVGGIHEWVLKAVEVGNQTFSAINMRSWEALTGDEETYNLNITVE